MKITEAFNEYKEIRLPTWKKDFFYRLDKNGYLKNSNNEIVSYFLEEELMSEEWQGLKKNTYEKDRKLIDVSVTWYPNEDARLKSQKRFVDDSWETFKLENETPNPGLMHYKLIMVKYDK